MKILVLISALLLGSISFASPECTKEPREKWMKSDVLKKQLENDGYKIKVFKTLETCYEIYGFNKEGQKVEIYFNPVDGKPVKTEIKK